MSSLALIPLSCLLGSALAYLLGKKVNPALGGITATLAAFASFAFTLLTLARFNSSGTIEDNLFTWFSVADLTVDFTLRFDQLSAVMCLVITGIGTLIHLYSTGYMAHDESRPRFFAYLNLFMFSMLVLVLGGNLLTLFVGWEGVGLCSYLLIGFWHKNAAFAAAGRKAFVVNRIGDLGFLIAIFLLFREFGTVDFVELLSALPAIGESVRSFPDMSANFFLTLVALSLFVGAAGKSAQVPLFVWLPDAMAGPTPVSALIHAATMVTAGIYLMARLNPVFSAAPDALAVVLVIAIITALLAALIAITQNDIKKVLAYSTVSQLGFMFMAAGAGAYGVAIFHVVTHAFFKACLFLTAGSVIHGCHHEQDMRHMGGLWKKMPITALTYLLSTIAIAGIFPFAGYFSKHAILEALHSGHNETLGKFAEYLPMLASFAALLTAFYMTRSFCLTFLGSYRGHAHPHESPISMTIPLLALAVLSTGGGLWLSGAFGEQFNLLHWLSPVVGGAHNNHEPLSIVAALAASWVGFLGCGAALFLYTVLPALPPKIFTTLGFISRASQNKFYVDELYQFLIIKPLALTARLLWSIVDKGIVDGTVNGTASLVDVTGEIGRALQSGQTRYYAALMLGGISIMIWFLFA